MIHLQKFLHETGGALELLQSNFGVYHKQHPKYQNLYQFFYDQIESYANRMHPIVIESRGIILDRANNWEVVSRPFDRFFNLGEDPNQQFFDWDSVVAQEKVDGSLMFLYYYDNQWQVATKGSPDAGGNVGQESFTFADLFWKTMPIDFPGFMDNFVAPGFTYIFELTSKYNRIVTNQADNEGTLTLLAIRSKYNGREYNIHHSYQFVHNHLEKFVKTHPLKTLEQVNEAVNQLDPTKQEGFVLVDKNFNRIKVKSEKYVLIHHMRDSVATDAKLIELIIKKEHHEFITYFPDLNTRFDELESRISNAINLLDGYWKEQEWDGFYTKKDCALFIQQHYEPKYHAFLYAMYDGKVDSASDWFSRLSPAKIVDLIG